MTIVIQVVALSAIYGIVIMVSVLFLRRAGIPGQRAIILGFLAFGALTGLLTTLAWPLDSIVLYNWLAVLLGDVVYTRSIQYLGNPSSASAHSTIPWVLRVPQVYVPVAVILSGLVGAVLQSVYNRIRYNKPGTASR